MNTYIYKAANKALLVYLVKISKIAQTLKKYLRFYKLLYVPFNYLQMKEIYYTFKKHRCRYIPILNSLQYYLVILNTLVVW